MNIKNKIIMKMAAVLCAMSTISLASIPAIANPRTQSDEGILNHDNQNSQEFNFTIDLSELEEQKNESENKNATKNKAKDNFKKQNSDNSDLKMLGQKRSKPDDDDEISLSSSEQSSDESQSVPQSQLIQKNPIIPFLKPAQKRFSNDPMVEQYNQKCKQINKDIKKANSNFLVDPNKYKELTEKSKELSLEFDLYSNLNKYKQILSNIQKKQQCLKNICKKNTNLKSNKKIEKFFQIRNLINNSKYNLKKSDIPTKISLSKFNAIRHINVFSELFEKITNIENDKVEKVKDSIQKFKDTVVSFKYVMKEFEKTKNEFEYTPEIKDGLEKIRNMTSKFQSVMPIIDKFNIFSLDYYKETFNDAVDAFNNLTDEIEKIPEIKKTTAEIENIIEQVKKTANKSESTSTVKDKTIQEIENMIKKMASIKETIENVIKIKDAKIIFKNIAKKSKKLLKHTDKTYDKYILDCDLFPVVIGLLGRPDVPNDELLNCKNMSILAMNCPNKIYMLY